MKLKWMAGLLVLLSLPFAAGADLPGKHPFYLHALSDLRGARWLLEHRPGDEAVSGQEDLAIAEIDKTINEIKHASIDDGKDLRDHLPMDVQPDARGRLHRALDVLQHVHSDLAREEDDPMTRGLRDRAIVHLDEAIHATEHAIGDVERGR